MHGRRDDVEALPAAKAYRVGVLLTEAAR